MRHVSESLTRCDVEHYREGPQFLPAPEGDAFLTEFDCLFND